MTCGYLTEAGPVCTHTGLRSSSVTTLAETMAKSLDELGLIQDLSGGAAVAGGDGALLTCS